jgi:hypothetical protein
VESFTFDYNVHNLLNEFNVLYKEFNNIHNAHKQIIVSTINRLVDEFIIIDNKFKNIENNVSKIKNTESYNLKTCQTIESLRKYLTARRNLLIISINELRYRSTYYKKYGIIDSNFTEFIRIGNTEYKDLVCQQIDIYKYFNNPIKNIYINNNNKYLITNNEFKQMKQQLPNLRKRKMSTYSRPIAVCENRFVNSSAMRYIYLSFPVCGRNYSTDNNYSSSNETEDTYSGSEEEKLNETEMNLLLERNMMFYKIKEIINDSLGIFDKQRKIE